MCRVFRKEFLRIMIDIKGLARWAAGQKRKMAMGVAAVLMMALMLSGFTLATNLVYIYDGDQTERIYTTESDYREILSDRGIVVRQDDKVAFSGFENNIGKIYITRAFTVMVTADKVTQRLSMTGGTVADALAMAGVSVSEDDLINAALTEPVYAGTDIVINRVTYTEETKTEAIPFEVVEKENGSLLKGTRTVTTAGKEGVKTTVYRTTLIDGEAVETVEVSSAVTTEPVNQVVSIGTKTAPAVKAATTSQEVTANAPVVQYANRVYLGRFKITAYCNCASCCGKWAGMGITASGARLQAGVTIAAPSRFAFGTKLEFNNHVYTVQDRGGAIKGNIIDLYVPSHAACYQWGARYFDVYQVS